MACSPIMACSRVSHPARLGPPTLPLRRYRTDSQLPGPLHPSRRHLQPSPRGLRQRSRLLPLARLCPWRQEQGYDSFSRRVPAPVSSPRFAQRPGPPPPLRPVRKPKTANRPRTLPPVARPSCLRRSPRTNEPTALSRLLRHYAGHRTDDECSTLLPVRPGHPCPTRGATLTAHSTSRVHDVSAPVHRGHARTCKGVVRPKTV